MLLDDEPAQLDGKYLGSISSDFILIADLLKEASYQMRVRHISEHPVFVICRTAQPIGSLLLAAGQRELKWNYYVSMLDEFIQRDLVPVDGVDTFVEAYKDPEEYCCLFVVDKGFTNFVFIPYPEDDDQEEGFLN